MSDQTTEATSQMPLEADNGNPSMEDILSSIRRIIADDDAQAALSAPEGTVEANLTNLAVTTPEEQADAALILDVDTNISTDEVLDLEDILILDEDDYSDDALAIPDVDMLEQALTIDDTPASDDVTDLMSMDLISEAPDLSLPDIDLTEPSLEPDTSAEDTGALDIEQMLESSLDDLDMLIVDDQELSASPAQVTTETATFAPTAIEITTPEIITNATPDTDADAGTLLSDSLALEEDIFSAIEQDLDLVLDDGGAMDLSTPEASSQSPMADDNMAEDDMAAVLSVIDDSISAIEDPQTNREASAIEIEALLDGDFTGEDALDDIMATLLDDTDDATSDLDMPADPVITPELEPALEPTAEPVLEPEPEIGDITMDTDIELVKSLMADLTMEDVLEDTGTQDALVSPEPTSSKDSEDAANPIIDLSPEPDTIDNVLDDIFELAMEDEEISEDDQSVASVDASISSLLKIAAEAEHDANPSLPPIALQPEPTPEVTPEVLDIMPTQIDPADREIEDEPDIDALFKDSLMTSEDAPNLTPSTVAPETIAEPESHSPTLAIEALAAQTFSIDALFDDEDEDPELAESVAAMTTPETAQVEEALPAPTVDEAILPSSEVAPALTSEPVHIDPTPVDPVGTAPLTLPDPEPTPRIPVVDEALVAEALTEPEPDTTSDIEANPTVDIAPTAALTPEKESPEMTKAATAKAANESILDEVTESATSGAFASLTDLVEAQNEFEASGPRIGDLVQEALRPMLKEWLDENLKNIVERAVQKEVKRISSGS